MSGRPTSRILVSLLFSATVLTGCEELLAPPPINPTPPPTASAPLRIQWNCAMFPALAGNNSPRILFTAPPLSSRQQQFAAWFNRAALSQDPRLANVFVPFYTLVGQDNALANPQGIMLNPEWFARIGDIASTGIFAHELAHLAQFYGLVQAAPPVGTQFEGQADYVSGYTLRLSGLFSDRDAREYAAFLRRFGGAGSSTHPAGDQREYLFLLGWNRAGSGN